MIETQNDILNKNNLNTAQKETLLKYEKKLAQELPNFRIAWVHPYNDDIIELHLEREKWTYRTSLKAARIATDIEFETGVTIILR